MLFYEDIDAGWQQASPQETIDREEMLAFARTWDPLPIHVDEAVAGEHFGGLIAPGLYTLAVKLRLIHRSLPLAVIASMGYDEVRFRMPLRPGDRVRLVQRCVARRESGSKPDCGIVTLEYSLLNQNGEIVLSHRDSLLMRRRAT